MRTTDGSLKIFIINTAMINIEINFREAKGLSKLDITHHGSLPIFTLDAFLFLMPIFIFR